MKYWIRFSIVDLVLALVICYGINDLFHTGFFTNIIFTFLISTPITFFCLEIEKDKQL